MKYVLTLVVILSLIISAAPAFAAGKGPFQVMGDYLADIGKPSEGGAVGVSKNSLFQVVSDDIAGVGKQGSVPGKDTVLQQLKENIDTWDDSQTEVKNLSLRDNKAELARRRGIK